MSKPRHPFANMTDKVLQDEEMIELPVRRDYGYEKLKALQNNSLFQKDIFNGYIKPKLRFRDLLSVRSTCKDIRHLIKPDWVIRNRFSQYFPIKMYRINNKANPRPVFRELFNDAGIEDFYRFLMDGEIESSMQMLDQCGSDNDQFLLITSIRNLVNLYNAIHYDSSNRLRNRFLKVIKSWYTNARRNTSLNEIKDKYERTYVHWIFVFNDVQALQELFLQEGNSVALAVKQKSLNGQTPLHIAASLGHLPIFDFLLKCYAESNIENKCFQAHICISIAAEHGQLAVVKRLLEYALKVNNKYPNNLELAVLNAAYNGYVDIIRCLIDYKANINSFYLDKRTTPLFLAAQNGHALIVSILLRSGADTSIMARFTRKNLKQFIKDEPAASQERMKLFLTAQPDNAELIEMSAADIASVMGHFQISEEIEGEKMRYGISCDHPKKA